jgi:hypothetical protein
MIADELTGIDGDRIDPAVLDGKAVARFRPQVEPEDDQVTRAIERVLP